MASGQVPDAAKISQVRERFLKKYNGSILDDTYDERDVDWVKSSDPAVWNIVKSYRSGGNVEKSADMLNEQLLFRAKYKLNDLKETDLHPELRQINPVVIQGKDKQGRPVMHFLVGKLKKGRLLEESKQYMAWFCNKYYMQNPDKPVVFLFDLTGAGIANLDLDMSKFIITCTNTYFPGIVDLNLMYKMNPALEAIWMIIKGFMDPDQSKNTVFVKRKNIQQYIDKDQLPDHMIKDDKE